MDKALIGDSGVRGMAVDCKVGRLSLPSDGHIAVIA